MYCSCLTLSVGFIVMQTGAACRNKIIHKCQHHFVSYPSSWTSRNGLSYCTFITCQGMLLLLCKLFVKHNHHWIDDHCNKKKPFSCALGRRLSPTEQMRTGLPGSPQHLTDKIRHIKICSFINVKNINQLLPVSIFNNQGHIKQVS